MKVERIDILKFHVKDLEQSVKFFSELMGIQFLGPIEYPGKRIALGEGIQVSQGTSPDTSIAKWIDEHGEGLVSIGLKVPDIDEAVAELEAKGFTLQFNTQDNPDLKIASMTPPPANAFGGLTFALFQYKDAPGFAMATFRKLGDLPWI